MTTPAQATGVYDLPYLSAGSPTWIVDQADVISRANEGTLNNTLGKLAAQTGQEVRMITVRRLEYDETIDGLAEKIFTKWYPTPEEQENETILVLDTLTNNAALRTGDTAQLMLSDEIAASVVKETIGVPIRDGNKYNQALLDARDRLVAVLSGEADPGPPQVRQVNVEGTFTAAEDTDTRGSTIWVVVLLVLATVIPMATYFWYVGFD